MAGAAPKAPAQRRNGTRPTRLPKPGRKLPSCSLGCQHARESRWRRRFSTHGKKEAHPTEMQVQVGHSDNRSTVDTYTQIRDLEVPE